MKTSLRKAFFVVALLLLSIGAKAAATSKIKSPNGVLTVELRTGKGQFGWTVKRRGKVVYTMNDISLTVGGQVLGGDAAVKGVKQKSVAQTINPVVPLKFSTIADFYNEATINFGTYQVLLRVMDNAVAHRFVTNIKGEVEVKDEQFTIVPVEGCMAHYQTCGSFNTSYEEAYQH